MGKIQRNIIIVQALYNIAGQTVGERADFQHCLHLAAFKAHAARHDKADIAAAQNNDFVPGDIAFHVNHALCRTGGKYACGAFTRDTDSAAGTFAAAHC